MYIGSSEIGDVGVQYLAVALQDNQVKVVIFSLPVSHIFHHHCCLQTLTYLSLDNNRITHVGAQYIATAIRDNKVIILVCSLFLAYSSCSLLTVTQGTESLLE